MHGSRFRLCRRGMPLPLEWKRPSRVPVLGSLHFLVGSERPQSRRDPQRSGFHECRVVDVGALTPSEKDAVTHYVDFAWGAFGSVPPSGAPGQVVRSMAEDAFWATRHEQAPEGDSLLLEVVTADGAVCACVCNSVGVSPVLEWMFPLLSASPRTAWTLAKDAHEAAVRALTAHQVQTTFSTSSRHIPVSTLCYINDRHLSALALATRRDTAVECLVGRLVTSPAATAQLLEEELVFSQRVLSSPRWAAVALRNVLLHGDGIHHITRRRFPAHPAAPTWCPAAASLLAALDPHARAGPSPVPSAAELQHILCGDCVLMGRAWDSILPPSGPQPASRVATLRALSDALSAAYEKLKQQENELLAWGDSTMFVTAEDEWSADAVSLRGARLEAGGSAGSTRDLYTAGLFDRCLAQHSLSASAIFSSINIKKLPAEGRDGGATSTAHTADEVGPLPIPSVGIDAQRHLTSILHACDMLCAACGIDPSCGAPEDSAGGHPGLLRERLRAANFMGFQSEVQRLRHLARVALARRYMTRVPSILWQAVPPCDAQRAGPPSLDRTRALPFLQELTRSLCFARSQRGRLVVLLVHTQGTSPWGAAAMKAISDSSRAFLHALSFLCPEWTPQLLCADRPTTSSLPPPPGPAAAGADDTDLGHPLPCWSLSWSFQADESGRRDGWVASDHATGELVLTLGQLRLMDEHLRLSLTAGGSPHSAFALRCSGTRCESIWPLETLTLEKLFTGTPLDTL